MTSNIQEAGRTAPASSTKKAGRPLCAGIAAALLLSCSPIALHAETSNAELAKEIAELKSQIREMKGAISSTRSEVKKVKIVASRTPAPVLVPAAYPAGAVPAFVTADKKLIFGGITITPGGFLAAEGVFRSKTTQSDILTNFNAIPTDNNPLAHVGESKFTARQSRFALLVEGAITPNAFAAAYGEFDFLGAGINSNNTQGNSYNPRIRHLYGTVDFNDYGMHVLAGQTWSLVTLNSKGITPRNEVPPPQIDAGFIPGFEFARIPQIRLTKDFNKKLWISVDAESAATNNASCQGLVSNTSTAAVANGTGISGVNAAGAAVAGAVPFTTCNAVATGGSFGQTGDADQLSLNKVPDILAKVAYEAKFADRDIHLEGFGLYRSFVSYSGLGAFPGAGGYTTSSEKSTDGYGVGAGLIVPVIPKKLDLQMSGLIGRGIGRYTSSGLADATLNGDGSVSPIKGAAALVGVTYHITPSIDLWAFGGFEQVNRTYSQTAPNTFVGYGAPVAYNADVGCESVGSGTCQTQTHRIFQITGGMWDKIYKGSFGEVRVGVQYSFTERQLYQTLGSTAAANFGQKITPKSDDNMVLTSFRYYPFQ